MRFTDPRGRESVRYRIRVSRSEEARGLTHLAQIERLRRAVVASGLPAAPDSRRKRSRPRLAFGPAISMGYESLAEYFDLELSGAREPKEIAASLGRVLGDGLSVRSVRRIPRFYPSLDSTLNVVRYELRGPFPGDAAPSLERFLARPEIIIEKLKDGGSRRVRIDARPLILEMAMSGADTLRLLLRFGPNRTVKPEAVVREWLGLENPLGAVLGAAGSEGGPAQGAVLREALAEPLAGFRIVRTDLLSETARGQLLDP